MGIWINETFSPLEPVAPVAREPESESEIIFSTDFEHGSDLELWEGNVDAYIITNYLNGIANTSYLRRYGSSSHANAYLNVALREQVDNLEVSLWVWTDGSGTTAPRGGPTARVQPDSLNTYYNLYFEPSFPRVSIDRWDAGVATSLLTVSLPSFSAQWLKLILRCKDGSLYMDIQRVGGISLGTGTVSDSTYTQGLLGLHFYDSGSKIDDFMARKA